MEKQYSWKMSGFYDKADANIVGKEIDELSSITCENVVEKAKDETTELHKLFEWDNNIAGEKYRKIQANQIIQNIQVVVKKGDEKNAPTLSKAFVTLKKNTEFEPIEVVVNNPEKYNALLDRATRQLKTIREKYAELEELQSIFTLIDEL